MKILPTPPTENLYKFSAITGLWLVVALVVFYSWLSHSRFRNDEDFKKQMEYHYSLQKIDEINAALDALKAGRPPESEFKGMPTFADSAMKERFLNDVLKNHKDSVEQNKALATKKIGSEYKELDAAGFYWLMPLLVFLGAVLFYWGFSRWYTHIQKPSDERSKLDFSIAEATLQKIEMEIRKLTLETSAEDAHI